VSSDTLCRLQVQGAFDRLERLKIGEIDLCLAELFSRSKLIPVE
jgi:hypothetical protein